MRRRMEIEAWHATATDPAAGRDVKRPAHVTLVVSTGPPKRLVPALDGLDAAQIEQTLRDAGFAPDDRGAGVGGRRARHRDLRDARARARASRSARRSRSSSRASRAGRAVSQVESTEDADEQTIADPGGRDGSCSPPTTRRPFGHGGGKVDVEWSGDEEGSTKLRAGESAVLADVSDHDRTIAVRGRRQGRHALAPRGRGDRARAESTSQLSRAPRPRVAP